MTITAATLAVATTGCQALGNSSCTDHSAGFNNEVAGEGALDQVALESAAYNPEATQYPMAVVISQPALNKLFAAVAGTDVPAIPLSTTVLGVPVGVTIRPALPLLQIGGEQGCIECLLTEVGFGLEFNVAGAIFGGAGAGRYQFPLFMTPTSEQLDATSVIASLDQASVLSLDIDVIGIDSAIMDAVEPLIASAVQSYVRSDVGETHLMDLESWDIGDGDVKLVGHGPHIEAATETIVIGMHSNLVRPSAQSVAWQPALPIGADIGLQFHPELVQSMIGRLMNEGHIDRSYDAAGNAQVDGDHQVTLSHMQASDNNLLNTGFTLWRTGGGLCGFADLSANMGLSISDKRLALAIQDVQVTDSAGAGQLLQLTSEWAGSDFLNNVASFSELTLNYDKFALPNDQRADMSAESFNLNLDASGLSLFLNIEQIVGIDE